MDVPSVSSLPAKHVIHTLKSDIEFEVSYPKENSQQVLQALTKAMEYAGLFDGLNTSSTQSFE
jgi:hypothetical protein